MDYQNEVGVKVTTNGTIVNIGNVYHDSFFNNDFYNLKIAYVSGGEIKIHSLPVLADSIISKSLSDLGIGENVKIKMTVKNGTVIINTIDGKEVA